MPYKVEYIAAGKQLSDMHQTCSEAGKKHRTSFDGKQDENSHTGMSDV